MFSFSDIVKYPDEQLRNYIKSANLEPFSDKRQNLHKVLQLLNLQELLTENDVGLINNGLFWDYLSLDEDLNKGYIEWIKKKGSRNVILYLAIDSTAYITGIRDRLIRSGVRIFLGFPSRADRYTDVFYLTYNVEDAIEKYGDFATIVG